MDKYVEKVKRLKDAIENDNYVKRYFFSKSTIDEEWFDALHEEGILDIAMFADIVKVGKQVEYPIWIEGDYLLRVTPAIPQKVIGLIRSYDTKKIVNPILKAKLIEIMSIALKTSCADDVEDLIMRIGNERWFDSKYQHLLAYPFQDLFNSLLKQKRIGIINILLETSFTFKLPPAGSRHSLDPQPQFDTHIYERLLESISDTIFVDKTEGLRMVEILSELLRQYIELDNKIHKYRSNEDDTSVIWLPRVEQENSRFGHLNEKLAITLRNILEINKDSLEISFLESVISSNKFLVHRRIILYIISRVKIGNSVNEVLNFILESLPITDTKHEIRLVLAEHYQRFTQTQKQKILQAIEELNDYDILLEQKLHLVEQGVIESQEKLQEVVAKYIESQKLHYLKVIEDNLTTQEKQKYGQLLEMEDTYEPRISLSSGMRSGPNSRYSREDIVAKTVPEVVQTILIEDSNWYTTHVHNEEMNAPEGLARLWEADVIERWSEYYNHLDLFLPNKALAPSFICHLIGGFEKVAKDTKTNLDDFIDFLANLVTIYQQDELPDLPVQDGFDYGSWREIIISTIRFLDDTLKLKTCISIEKESSVWKLLEFCLSYEGEDEVKNSEKLYLNDDVYGFTINSIHGISLHAIIHFNTWLNQNKKLKQPELDNRVKDIITSQLKLDLLSPFSVVGHYYPVINYYDRKFAVAIVPALFENKDKEKYQSAWESFLFNSVYKDFIVSLFEGYKNFLNFITDHDTESRLDPRQKVVEHIMVAYCHDLGKSSELFDHLFSKSNEIKEYAIEFIGRAFIPADSAPKDNSIKERIKQLWVRVLEDGTEPKTYLSGIGWWIVPNYFDNKWMLKNLIRTLEQSRGRIDPDFRVLASLATLSEEFPKETATALELMVKGEDSEKTYYFRDKEISTILKNTEKSKDTDTLLVATSIREELVSYGFINYRKHED